MQAAAAFLKANPGTRLAKKWVVDSIRDAAERPQRPLADQSGCVGSRWWGSQSPMVVTVFFCTLLFKVSSCRLFICRDIPTLSTQQNASILAILMCLITARPCN